MPFSAPRRNAFLFKPKRVVGEAPTTAREARALPRIVRAAATKDNEHEQATGALARDEWAESIPGFAPFAFALPELGFQVSEVIGVAFYFV